jgi:hypothetical protein
MRLLYPHTYRLHPHLLITNTIYLYLATSLGHGRKLPESRHILYV